ncbi:MAG: histidinol-phosphatase [Planctomycetaceae bacterium]|nr:histidinol-phosphatase [Planctomycetaceae bacterium]MCA9122674.1 histidinol-phosphatase [Planctomycetales bacterium]MCB9924645.1 histidinol-phosphatase [Planctomycetaceae bacterium]
MAVEVSARLKFAIEIARAAGDLTLEYFQRSSVQIERKGDDSPVTQADRQSELLMRERIAKAFPNDAIIGEEHGEAEGTSGYKWILDPIDGTKSFIAGVPLYSVLVGVVRKTESLIGVIRIPGLDECVYAEKGQGAWWTKGEAAAIPARVSNRNSLADGVFVTSQVDTFDSRSAIEAYQRLERAAYVTRTWGDGYGYLLVATGRAEAMVDPMMNIWDAAAIQPVLEEAGGTFTDWKGKPCIDGSEGIGTNGLVLNEVLEITQDYPRPS